MGAVDGFSVSPVEGLRSPYVVLAFMGWSDTGTVTTDAARHLVEVYGGERFLTVDPEEYYVFTEVRPTVRLDEHGIRVIEWPQNEAYAIRLPDHAHDLIVVSGVEPNLRWRTFSERLAEVLASFSPTLVCTLVARPAATPHTRPVPVSGSSADPVLAAKYGLGRSLYQGPTGIVGAIHDALRRRGAALISLAAGIPHYLNVPENPPGTIALLEAFGRISGIDPRTDLLARARERFLARVDEASHEDDQIEGYVRSLEEHYGDPDLEEEAEVDDSGLPSADDILRDVEDFLRGGGDASG